MTACAIDWRLILEYVKVLATPLTAVLVVILGVRAFRAQKLIERRLDWYEKTHQLLGRTSDRFAQAGFISDAESPRRLQRANDAASELGDLVGAGWLYAKQDGFTALQVLSEEIASTLVASHSKITQEVAVTVAAACQRAANVLADEMREELRAPRVVAMPGITKTTSNRGPAA